MNPEIETALQLAILEHPAIFGLRPAEINPLVLYVQHLMDFELSEEVQFNLWRECFARAKQTLDEKLLALTGCFSMVKEDLTIPPEPKDPEPEPVPTRKAPARKSYAVRAVGNSRPRRNASPQREATATPRQIKYYGFLCHDRGETPDYTGFAKLTMNQASARIKAMGGK